MADDIKALPITWCPSKHHFVGSCVGLTCHRVINRLVQCDETIVQQQELRPSQSPEKLGVRSVQWVKSVSHTSIGVIRQFAFSDCCIKTSVWFAHPLCNHSLTQRPLLYVLLLSLHPPQSRPPWPQNKQPCYAIDVVP